MAARSRFKKITLHLLALSAFGLILGSQSVEAAPANYCTLTSLLSIQQVAQDQCLLLKSGVEDPAAATCLEETKSCEQLIADRLLTTVQSYAKEYAYFSDEKDGTYRILDDIGCYDVVHEIFLNFHAYKAAPGNPTQSFEEDFLKAKDGLKSACVTPAPAKPATPADPADAKAAELDDAAGCSLQAGPSLGTNYLWALLLALPFFASFNRRIIS